MAVTTFAAIDIGSYEISMKIFEFSKKIGFRELNDVRYLLAPPCPSHWQASVLPRGARRPDGRTHPAGP